MTPGRRQDQVKLSVASLSHFEHYSNADSVVVVDHAELSCRLSV